MQGPGQRRFGVGDIVVSAHHGAGTIVGVEQREANGEQHDYLTLLVHHTELTVTLPLDARLRPIADEETLDRLASVLGGATDGDEDGFKARFRQASDKLKSGDVLELGSVVRDLILRERAKTLSTQERQLLGRARRMLQSELAFALGADDEAASEWVDHALRSGATLD